LEVGYQPGAAVYHLKEFHVYIWVILLPCPPGFMLLLEHRQVCKSGGVGMLLSAYMKI